MSKCLKNKLGLIILVALFFIMLTQIGRTGPYKVPIGYSSARETWQQKGLDLNFDRKVNGTEKYPYDVIVWGSDPEGVAAAVSAARNGLYTLLIDHRDKVGGLYTLGQLNLMDMNYETKLFRKKLVTAGLFHEFYSKVGGNPFEIDRGQAVLDEMVAGEELLTVMLDSELVGIGHNGDNRIISLTVEVWERQLNIHGRVFIDASQDADLAYRAGVPFTEGFEDIGMPGKFQAGTLVFSLKGINWYRVMWESLIVDRRRSSAATFRSAWGYDQYIGGYTPASDRISFRGFNMVRQKDGRVLINGLLIYGLGTGGALERNEAMAEAKEEAYRFAEYARQHLPGFQNAVIDCFAPELYVRQTRNMLGLYRLTIDDVLENRDHWDRIGYGSYPVDVQALDKNSPGFVLGDPEKYAIPFRCLVPPNVDNLLVVGRSASYDSLAHGSARVVPVGMVEGQAAGVAAVFSLATGQNFWEIAGDREALDFIRDILAGQGAYVEPSGNGEPAAGKKDYYPAMQYLRRLGLITGGYSNDYKLGEPISAQAFLNLLFHGASRIINLADKGVLAEKMYYVSAGGEFVSSANLYELVEHFNRFNPHLSAVLPEQDSKKIWLEVDAAIAGNEEFARGQLYEAVFRYLVLLEGHL
jgi:hypothetical protein